MTPVAPRIVNDVSYVMRWYAVVLCSTEYCGVPKGGVFKGGNWGTLRIPREDWGTLGH